MANIGFVGLGHMGLPMTVNLIKAGHQVTGYDIQQSAVEELIRSGGVGANNVLDAVSEQDVVITMLQKGQQVLEVCDGEQGLFNNAKKGCLYIDCSTIDVDSSRQVHQLAKSKKLFALDAPVSGGVAGAIEGTLTFMVGGEEEAFNKAKPFFLNMGKKIIHTGANGSGQAAKICNNLILGASMIAVSEAFILSEHLGLDREKLREVVTNASGQCWTMSNYVPVSGILKHVPAENEYKPGFAAAMMLKDLMLGSSEAKQADLNLPLGFKATALYQQFIDQGFGDLDFSAIIKFISQLSEAKE